MADQFLIPVLNAALIGGGLLAAAAAVFYGYIHWRDYLSPRARQKIKKRTPPPHWKALPTFMLVGFVLGVLTGSVAGALWGAFRVVGGSAPPGNPWSPAVYTALRTALLVGLGFGLGGTALGWWLAGTIHDTNAPPKTILKIFLAALLGMGAFLACGIAGAVISLL